MTKPYIVQACCLRPFITALRVNADSPREAVHKARRNPQALRSSAEEQHDLYAWDEFAVFDESGEQILHVLDHEARIRQAAPLLLDALQEALAEIAYWHEDMLSE